MYCYATHKRHKTQTHAMNARAVYEKFKSRELIKKSCVSLHQRVRDRDIISSRVCVRSLLPSAKVTEMYVGFLPFIRKPITEYLTVYTSMLDFVKIAEQLDQNTLTIFVRVISY